MAAARHAFIRRQPALDPERLVFLDETSATTNMTRRLGRCARGLRLLAPVPHGHRKTTTLVAGLRTTGITAPYVLDGAVNGDIFRGSHRADPRPNPERGRHCRHGQSALSQGRRHSGGHRKPPGPVALPAALQPDLRSPDGRALLARALAAGVPCAWVATHSVYGGDYALRLWLERQPIGYVLAVTSKQRPPPVATR